MTYALQRDDENYLDVVDNYKNEAPRGEREIDYFTEAFGLLQEGMAESNHDILGVIYEEMGNSSDHFGQHFTPHNLCDAKAEMVIDEETDGEDPYTVMDPASGSGRLLISAAKKNPDGIFYGVDKDSTCAKMTALNLTFFNVDGYAVQGDSLKLDYNTVWQTRHTPLGGKIQELDESQWENPADEAPEQPEQVERPEQTKPPKPNKQKEDDKVVDFSELRETTLSDFTGGQ